MKIRTIVHVAICFAISVLIVAGLFLLSAGSVSGNGFTRMFPPHFLEFRKMADFRYPGYYVSGTTSKVIYFGNYHNTSELRLTDYSLDSITDIVLTNYTENKIAWKTAVIRVDSPYYSIIDRVTASLIKTNMVNGLSAYYRIDSAQFSLLLPVSPGSLVIRTFDKIKKVNILNKRYLSELNHSQTFMLEKQMDGFFSTDGTLSYNKKFNTIIYTYSYRNQYLCFDTNLNLQFRGQTIDTNTIAKIKVSAISGDSMVTMSAPPLVVNRSSQTAGKWLFVKSDLRAGNENPQLYKEGSWVIDIYSLIDHRYLYSFYLPPSKGKPVTAFYVLDDLTVLAQHENIFVAYRMNLNLN